MFSSYSSFYFIIELFSIWFTASVKLLDIFFQQLSSTSCVLDVVLHFKEKDMILQINFSQNLNTSAWIGL